MYSFTLSLFIDSKKTKELRFCLLERVIECLLEMQVLVHRRYSDSTLELSVLIQAKGPKSVTFSRDGTPYRNQLIVL